MEDRLIAEAGKALCQYVDQSCSGVIGAVNAVDEAAAEFLSLVSIGHRNKAGIIPRKGLRLLHVDTALVLQT